jgi:hypothetical protein
MDKLVQIHPHRPEPDDIEYRSSREFAFCPWCKHHKMEGGQEWHPDEKRYVSGYHVWWDVKRYYHACSNRKVIDLDPRDPDRAMHCIKVNLDGSCEFFEPNWWTRFLRTFHLGRAPVLRPPIVEKP